MTNNLILQYQLIQSLWQTNIAGNTGGGNNLISSTLQLLQSGDRQQQKQQDDEQRKNSMNNMRTDSGGRNNSIHSSGKKFSFIKACICSMAKMSPATVYSNFN